MSKNRPIPWSLQTFSVIPALAFSICIALAQSACTTSGNTSEPQASPMLSKAVSCLMASKLVVEYGLPLASVKKGDWVWARYKVGSVPGMEGGSSWYNVILYSHGGNRGVLLFADPNKRSGFDVIDNAYRLVRHGGRWMADTGWGGNATYTAYGKFAATMEKKPRYRVHLVPGGSDCGPDEPDTGA